MTWQANPDLLDSLSGSLPPWADRFVRRVGSAVHRFSMIADGDEVLVGVSGGKDSLALCLALELRRRRVLDRYRLSALMIDWVERPATGQALRDLEAYFEVLGMPFQVRRVSLKEESEGREPGCYECARARKKALFQAARERGVSRIALGHHLDDFAETLLLNLTLHGRFEGMEPVRNFFGGEAALLRPLCGIREGTVRTFADRMGLPVSEPECPRRLINPRRKMKNILADMAKIDRLVREHMFSAYIRGTRRIADGSGSER